MLCDIRGKESSAHKKFFKSNVLREQVEDLKRLTIASANAIGIVAPTLFLPLFIPTASSCMLVLACNAATIEA
jgi:hypothetical protein